MKAIQSDWNQIDDTASDYIKNKPFYGTEEFFEKSVIAPASGQSYGGVTDLEIAQAIFDDYTCATITFFNGTFELDGIKKTYSYAIVYGVKGNDSYEVTVTLKDGKPNGDVSWNRGGYDYAPQAEIVIRVANSNFKKLDEKYIPDTIARTQSVNTSITTHNTSDEAHTDIRDLIVALTTKLNNFLDIDDTTAD